MICQQKKTQEQGWICQRITQSRNQIEAKLNNKNLPIVVVADGVGELVVVVVGAVDGKFGSDDEVGGRVV